MRGTASGRSTRNESRFCYRLPPCGCDVGPPCAALKGRGIDVPYIVKDDEGHGFRNEENQFEFYDAMEKFLDKHIGKSSN